MKSWDYYKLQGDYKYHRDFARHYLIKNRLVEKIKNTPLTEAQRDSQIKLATQRGIKIAQRANRGYHAEQAKRMAELEIDQRKAIGYNDLPAPIIQAIESKAWEDGHSNGLSEVYYHIEELVDFTRTIIKAHEAATNPPGWQGNL